MSNIIHLTYSCPASIAGLTDKAASVWNDILDKKVMLHPWFPPPHGAGPNITIDFANDVRTPDKPDRVGWCNRTSIDHWIIHLDGSGQTKWAISWWSRFLGRGENIYAALLHELGHVFGIKHLEDPNYVMHENIGGTGKLSRYERLTYRTWFEINQEYTDD